MEGVITVAVALFAMFFVVRFPDEERNKPSWRFLSRDNLEFVIARLNADRGDVEPDSFTWRRFLQPATVRSITSLLLIRRLMVHIGVVHIRLSVHSLHGHYHCECLYIDSADYSELDAGFQCGNVAMHGCASICLLWVSDVGGRVVQ